MIHTDIKMCSFCKMKLSPMKLKKCAGCSHRMDFDSKTLFRCSSCGRKYRYKQRGDQT
jgi:RNase P subunit RPR2